MPWGCPHRQHFLPVTCPQHSWTPSADLTGTPGLLCRGQVLNRRACLPSISFTHSAASFHFRDILIIHGFSTLGSQDVTIQSRERSRNADIGREGSLRPATKYVTVITDTRSRSHYLLAPTSGRACTQGESPALRWTAAPNGLQY
jgi:hypothetical protein